MSQRRSPENQASAEYKLHQNVLTLTVKHSPTEHAIINKFGVLYTFNLVITVVVITVVVLLCLQSCVQQIQCCSVA